MYRRLYIIEKTTFNKTLVLYTLKVTYVIIIYKQQLWATFNVNSEHLRWSYDSVYNKYMQEHLIVQACTQCIQPTIIYTTETRSHLSLFSVELWAVIAI